MYTCLVFRFSSDEHHDFHRLGHQDPIVKANARIERAVRYANVCRAYRFNDVYERAFPMTTPNLHVSSTEGKQ